MATDPQLEFDFLGTLGQEYPGAQEQYDFLGDFEPVKPQAPEPQQSSELYDFLAEVEQVPEKQERPSFIPQTEEKKTVPEKRQTELLKNFTKGLEESTSGELAKQFFEPGTQEDLAQDPSFWESLVHEAGTITGDLPYLAAGATLGGLLGSPAGPIGATVGGAFGAMALPAFLKESLRQYRDFQEKGGDLTFGEFLQRADKVANRTLNEGLFGVILGSVKKAMPLLEKTPIGAMFKSKVGKAAATVTAEAGVATAVPAAVQGRMPEKEDFAKALALFAGFNLAHLPANVREHIQKEGVKSGLTPEEFAESYSPKNIEKIKAVAEKAAPNAKAELPKDAILRKPEDIKTGMEAGKANATISVERDGAFFPHEIELTKEEKNLIDASNAWQKAGENAEASNYSQQAREMIFARLEREGVLPKGIGKAMPKPPEKPVEALKEAEARQTAHEGKTLAEAVSFEPPKIEKPSSRMGFRQAVIDELYPLQKYVEENKATKEIPFSQDPYKMARLYKGVSGKAEVFLEYKTYNPNDLTWTGKGLREILQPYRENLPGLSRYLVARRAVELSKQGKETGINIADATRYVKENAKNYEKAGKEIRQYQNSLLDYAQDSGLISEDTKSLWKNLSQDYVPFKRVFTPEESEKFFTKSMQPKQQFYKLEGSKRNIVDPLESIIGNTYSIIRASEQNRVIRSLVEFEKHKKGAGEFIEIKEVGSEPTLQAFTDFMQGKDIVEGNKVKYFEDGKVKTIEVQKDVADVLKGNFGPREMTYLGKLLSWPTRWIRTGAIGLNPEKLAKLAIQDQFEAAVYNETGYVPGVDLVRGIFNSVKKGDLYNKWRAAGGDQSLAMDMSRSRKQHTLQKIAGAKHVVRSVDDALRLVEEAFKPLETATRLSVFEKSLKRRGMSPDALREAALQAREITLDFAKRGAKTKMLTEMIPFFNSAVQGADKLVQEARRNPKGVAVKGAAYITVPTVMLWLWNKDRPDHAYEEIPDWEKNAFWHGFVDIPGIEKALHLRVPKPFELGYFFGSAPEHVLEYIDKNDPKALKELGAGAFDAFTPPLIPAGVRPMIEQFANKKLLTGAPIIPKRLENLPPEEQFTPYTSDTAKQIGKIIQHIPYVGDTKAASPVVVDHWISSMTGGLGRRLIEYTEKGLRKAGVLEKKVEVEPELADVPGIGFLFGKEPGTQSASIKQFYEESERLQKQYNSIRKAAKEGREIPIKNADEIVGRHKQALKIRRAFSNSYRAIENIVTDLESYTPAEKRILIDQLAKDMVGVSREFLGKEE